MTHKDSYFSRVSERTNAGRKQNLKMDALTPKISDSPTVKEDAACSIPGLPCSPQLSADSDSERGYLLIVDQQRVNLR